MTTNEQKQEGATPRTDKEETWNGGTGYSVDSSFARELERSLTAAQQRIAELEKGLREAHLATVELIDANNSGCMSDVDEAVRRVRSVAKKNMRLFSTPHPKQ